MGPKHWVNVLSRQVLQAVVTQNGRLLFSYELVRKQFCRVGTLPFHAVFKEMLFCRGGTLAFRALFKEMFFLYRRDPCVSYCF